ncbi:glycosyltransferase family 39 protein [Oricola sp.]|uniref:glycosyltransferase family 39 protein n=1 Tax=Oricola sp. TaxID=1979950 RepID=UPI0025FD0C2B|nr:glycosyltransferase family 39 protein [Oricola sp.]MCI5074949.1 glycosyltransferase family 39 protein [Oricola sp.]
MNTDGPTTTLSDPPPFWARPVGVTVICALWAGFHFWIAAFLRSALVVDDSLESFHSQSLEFFYASRNPALYDWILNGVNRIVGSSFYGAPLVNYASMLTCALLLYALARRVIADPRLQAFSVYSLSLLWIIGFESHRILAHSQVMIALMAAAILVFWSLGESRAVWKYLLLGALIPLGILAKYSFALFIGAIVAAALLERVYRRVVLDPRFLLTLLVAIAPLGLFFYLATAETQAIVDTSTGVLTGGDDAILKVLEKLLGAFAGYGLPFAAIYALVFFVPRPARKAGAPGPNEAFLRLNRTVLLIGVVVMVAWALGPGGTQLRPRYLHCLFLTLPLFSFMVLDRYQPTRRAIRSYATILLVMAVAIGGIYLAGRLAPSETLCGSCRPSVPYRQLGKEIVQRYGPAPVIVAPNRMLAGQYRAAVPAARAVALDTTEYAPPPMAASRCLLIWPSTTTKQTKLAEQMAEFGKDLLPDEQITLDWWAPLLPQTRQTTFNLQELPADAAPCR